jgi:hypothetical protein
VKSVHYCAISRKTVKSFFPLTFVSFLQLRKRSSLLDKGYKKFSWRPETKFREEDLYYWIALICTPNVEDVHKVIVYLIREYGINGELFVP